MVASISFWYSSRVRLALALVVVASTLVACGGEGGGGDEDPAPAAEPSAPTVESDDGKAVLTLPDGEDAGGVTVTAVEHRSGGIAYALGPSGRTFDDEPATLTISDVESPDPTAIPLAYVESDDGGIDLVDLDIDREHVDGVTTATFSLVVPHFSTAVIMWDVGELYGRREQQGVAIVELAWPSAVPPKVDFGVRSLVQKTVGGFRAFSEANQTPDYEVAFGELRASGTLTVTNAAPASFDRMPAKTATSDYNPVNSVATMQCLEPGHVGLSHDVRIEYDFVQTAPEERRGKVSTRVRSKARIPCRVGQVTTTSTLPVTKVRPIVEEIRVELNVPVTTYTVKATDPTGGALKYKWSVWGESCGTPKVPFGRETASITWSHADAPPDACAHTGTDHDVQLMIEVISPTGGWTTCDVRGSNSQVLTKPTCR